MVLAQQRHLGSGLGLGSQQAHSMLFSLSVDESPFAQREHKAALQAQLDLLNSSLAPLLQPHGPFSRKLLRDVMLFHDVLLAEEGDVDGVVLASKLTAAGYRVAVRQALGGGSGVQVFSNLRHSFLLVTAQDCPCAGKDFIVEPHFREQFEISHPTPRYSGLLSMLPSVLVGTAEQLTPLVQLLCSEMSLAFEQHGLSLPPWRQSKSLLSKWLPSKARDYDLSPYSSPRANSPEPLFPLAVISAAAAQQQQQALLPYEGVGAGAALQPISEGASGSITPIIYSGDDDTSPRAVLRGASDVLFSHQAAAAAAAAAAQVERKARGSCSPPAAGAGGARGQAGSAGAAAAAPAGPNPVRKSLLSSSLAASGQRAASPEYQPQPGSRALAGMARAASVPPLHLPPPRVPSPAAAPATAGASSGAIHHHGGASGLSYRVSSEWQQPAIRTVKMQGQSAGRPK